MRYIGVDLAWGERAQTGLAALDADGHLLASSLALDLDTIQNFIHTHAGKNCLVGIDAPLVVKNETGCRECERELLRRGIALYSANRTRLAQSDGRTRGEALIDRLSCHGFTLTDRHPASKYGGRFIYEVYPYSILYQHCFDPHTGKAATPRYKQRKGLSIDDRKLGIIELRDLIGKLDPPVKLSDRRLACPVGEADIMGYKNKELKAVGDLFDAVLAAYAVYAAQKLGERAFEIVGDLENGYVLVPRSKRKKDVKDA